MEPKYKKTVMGVWLGFWSIAMIHRFPAQVLETMDAILLSLEAENDANLHKSAWCLWLSAGPERLQKQRNAQMHDCAAAESQSQSWDTGSCSSDDQTPEKHLCSTICQNLERLFRAALTGRWPHLVFLCMWTKALFSGFADALNYLIYMIILVFLQTHNESFRFRCWTNQSHFTEMPFR